MPISENVAWITVPRSAYTFKIFLFAGARQKVDNIHRTIFFAFQFVSVIRLFPSFDNLNSFAIIFSVHSRTMITRLAASQLPGKEFANLDWGNILIAYCLHLPNKVSDGW